MSEQRTVDVVLGQGRGYPVYIGSDLLDRLGTLARAAGFPAKVVLVSNTTVYRLYGQRVLDSLLRAGFAVSTIQIPDGEQYKTLRLLECLYMRALGRGLDRSGGVIALGGGAIGDLAGFFAATYMRGLPVLQLPTTLLAQIDAAVGGKTAVNFADAKNLVGAFHQPYTVIADVSSFYTLPTRQLRSGYAEAVKHGIALDPDYYDLVKRYAKMGGTALVLKEAEWVEVVAGSVQLKAAVVQEDEKERGGRAVLNFGHTFGHAIEAAGGFRRYTHGEAVALGMIVACHLSHELRGFPARLAAELTAILDACGLPTKVQGVGEEEVFRNLTYDKKRSQGSLVMVLLDDVGKPVLVSDIPQEALRDAWCQVC